MSRRRAEEGIFRGGSGGGEGGRRGRKRRQIEAEAEGGTIQGSAALEDEETRSHSPRINQKAAECKRGTAHLDYERGQAVAVKGAAERHHLIQDAAKRPGEGGEREEREQRGSVSLVERLRLEGKR